VKLAILGGGGFRVPLIYQALAADGDKPLIRELRLFDPSPDRLAVIRNVLNQLGGGRASMSASLILTPVG
jgi:6-phospho-beta-glucosidase